MVRVVTAHRLILVGCALLTAGRVPCAFGEEGSLAGDAPQGTAQNEVPILDKSMDNEGGVTSVDDANVHTGSVGAPGDAQPATFYEASRDSDGDENLEPGTSDQLASDGADAGAVEGGPSVETSKERGWTSRGGGAPSHKWCRWSWAQKKCVPEDLCRYKYQFLDATVSESCRLKDFKTERAVFATSDLEVKPAHALAGAAGLFASDLIVLRSTDWLQKYPLLFNVVQGFILFVSGDTLFQVVEQGWHKKVGLRFWRMIRSGLIGALNNGLIHYSYYKWVDKRFPYHIFSEKVWGPKDGALSKLAVGFTKWAIEWPTIGVYKIISMYVLTAAMSRSLDTVRERIEDSFFLTWLRSLQVWPIYDMVLYAYVPTGHRPLFNSFMSILWGGYLSHVSQPHEDGQSSDEGMDIPEAEA